MTTDRQIRFVVGDGAWTEVSIGDVVIAYVRFALNDDTKSWRPSEVRIVDPTTEKLRRAPLPRIETAANASGIVALGLAIADKRKPPSDVPAYFEEHREKYK